MDTVYTTKIKQEYAHTVRRHNKENNDVFI